MLQLGDGIVRDDVAFVREGTTSNVTVMVQGLPAFTIERYLDTDVRYQIDRVVFADGNVIERQEIYDSAMDANTQVTSAGFSSQTSLRANNNHIFQLDELIQSPFYFENTLFDNGRLPHQSIPEQGLAKAIHSIQNTGFPYLTMTFASPENLTVEEINIWSCV